MVSLRRATAVAVTVLAVALGVAVGHAQGQLAAFRIRGGDGSIYVDVSGAYAFPLPYPVSGFTFLLNYSSTYIRPRLYREIARATIQPEVAVRLGYLSVRLDYSSEGGVGSAGVKASYTSPAGSALLEVGIRASRAGFEVGVLATGRLLVEDFGSFERFRSEFTEAALTVEGSGWAALTYCRLTDRLIIAQVEKHNVNLYPAFQVLLVVDVFEHAYYIDYRNDRRRYLENWWNLVNWDEVERRYSKLVQT